jgi:hypothetical protein
MLIYQDVGTGLRFVKKLWSTVFATPIGSANANRIYKLFWGTMKL